MWQIFVKGGPVMIILLICSVWGIYIFIQKLMYLKLNYQNMAALAQRLKDMLVEFGKESSILKLKKERSIVAIAFANLIRYADLSKAEVKEAMEISLQNELRMLNKDLNVLSSIIMVSPILGLLGTVLGLMSIFNVISGGGGLGNAEVLSGGIAQALITTVTGLAIAIPFIFIYHHLSHKIDDFIHDFENNLNDILRFLHRNEGVKP